MHMRCARAASEFLGIHPGAPSPSGFGSGTVRDAICPSGTSLWLATLVAN